MTQEGECQKELGFQKEEGGEMVGSDRWAINSACLPAGAEVDAEGEKQPTQGGLCGSPQGARDIAIRLR